MRQRVEADKKARTHGISLTPEAFEDVMGRVEALKPFVRSFSAYFQLLADIDQRDKLIEKELMRKLEENKAAVAEKLPPVRKIRSRELRN
jgi:hypothetical protein